MRNNLKNLYLFCPILFLNTLLLFLFDGFMGDSFRGLPGALNMLSVGFTILSTIQFACTSLFFLMSVVLYTEAVNSLNSVQYKVRYRSLFTYKLSLSKKVVGISILFPTIYYEGLTWVTQKHLMGFEILNLILCTYALLILFLTLREIFEENLAFNISAIYIFVSVLVASIGFRNSPFVKSFFFFPRALIQIRTVSTFSTSDYSNLLIICIALNLFYLLCHKINIQNMKRSISFDKNRKHQ
ncbi:MAG: hypothetical protein LBD38_02755 [Streptococcaceae bacterium]|jgi:hypothetical protein|nr:hypothetical protein [Streptococcaceae bacterium]